ncbi:hypothetical protein D6779_09050 [Candidatus Parcubacteria bacterium]|nr:MAG: hypothetical protein D6779_09050 [Candidatus Parcubacteria bacterium]
MKIQYHPTRLLKELEKNPEGYLQDFLSDISNTEISIRDYELGNYLLDFKEGILAAFGFTGSVQIPYHQDEKGLVLALLRILIEKALEDELEALLLRADVSYSDLWTLLGALCVHVQNFSTERGATKGAPIIELVGGKYHIRIPDHVVIVERNLSVAAIVRIMLCVGDDFLVNYLSNHVNREGVAGKFLSLTNLVARNEGFRGDGNVVTTYVTNSSVRNLQKATKNFRGDFGLRLHHACLAARSNVVQPHNLEMSIDFSAPGNSVKSLLDTLQSSQEVVFLRGCLDVEDRGEPCVYPYVDFFDDKGILRHHIDSEEYSLVGQRQICVVSSLGGQRILLRKFANQIRGTRGVIGFVVDLARAVQAGVRDLHIDAADELIERYQLDVGLRIALINELAVLDRKGAIFWILTGWDEIPKEMVTNAVMLIRPLRSYLLLTTDLYRTRASLYGDENTASWSIHNVLVALRYDDNQIRDFIDQFVARNPSVNAVMIRRLAAQLPGLASLPVGLEYICRSYADSPVDVLFNFLNRCDGADAAKKIVGQMFSHGGYYSFAELHYDQFANLEPVRFDYVRDQFGGNSGEIVEELFESAVRGDVLQPLLNSPNAYRFIVPEIGYLLLAAVISVPDPRINLKLAHDILLTHPDDVFPRIWLLYAAWGADEAAVAQCQQMIS